MQLPALTLALRLHFQPQMPPGAGSFGRTPGCAPGGAGAPGSIMLGGTRTGGPAPVSGCPLRAQPFAGRFLCEPATIYVPT